MLNTFGARHEGHQSGWHRAGPSFARVSRLHADAEATADTKAPLRAPIEALEFESTTTGSVSAPCREHDDRCPCSEYTNRVTFSLQIWNFFLMFLVSAVTVDEPLLQFLLAFLSISTKTRQPTAHQSWIVTHGEHQVDKDSFRVHNRVSRVEFLASKVKRYCWPVLRDGTSRSDCTPWHAPSVFQVV